MRYSQAFIPTLKEVPSDAKVQSHIFMVRGGYMRQVAAGIYNFLPLGLRVVQKIANIIREEMNRAGAHEVLMPAAVPAELWQESGRWEQYGPELLRFKDRKGGDFCIGPTHEEVIVDMVRRELSSYRDLPVNLYQIQSKFRDELRPRAGLMRGREFIMKDCYSFDVSDEAAKKSYDIMYEAYHQIFKRCGLDFRPVEADTGAIGGSVSHEFQVLAETGEDSIVSCDNCDYAANVELAEVLVPSEPAIQGSGDLEKVETPAKKTIEEVASFLKVKPSQLVKTLIYMADGNAVAVLVRGDRVVNDVAVKRLLGARELFLAREGQAKTATGAPTGFAGPVGLEIPIYADSELKGATGAVAGANEVDMHVTGLDLARDCGDITYAPLRMAQQGETCPRCQKGSYRSFRGIEVGHVFYLGTKYSEAMGCLFLDESGVQKPMVMGCYGIGVTRIAAAAIEQNHDKDGIIWPMQLAPYEVALLSLGNDEEIKGAADKLHDELVAAGVDVLYDDREERPGAKFKDAELIGIPLRLAIGKRSLKDGMAEVKWRDGRDAENLPLEGAAKTVAAWVQAETK